ncbi:MAG: DUF6456 domain-containing protein [Beijerinckiaceae bacterium]
MRLDSAPEESFRRQHELVREAALDDGPGSGTVLINDGESTLAWLHRRRGPGGAPLISSSQLAAGERLRADLTHALILPRVTSNWTSAVARGPRSADAAQPTDVMIAARQRVRAALSDVGQDFAGLLIDVCGFLKRLPEIEQERGWPLRSAKLVLDMALTRLARHYGLETEARGPERSNGVRFWGADDYRPDMNFSPGSGSPPASQPARLP